MNLKAIALMLASALAVVQSPLSAQSTQSSQAQADEAFLAHMQTRIQRLRVQPHSPSAGQSLINPTTLVNSYDSKRYAPIWTTPQGWNRNARGLLHYLIDLPRHGLDPRPYHLQALIQLSDENTLASRINSELLLSDALLSLAHDLAYGVTTKHYGAAKAQQLLLRLKPSEDPSREFDALLPQATDYWRLSASLKTMLEHEPAETGPQLRGTELLRTGSRAAEVEDLRLRLASLGYLASTEAADAHYFDSELRDALMAYQADKALKADGMLGAETRRRLNMGRLQMIEIVSANLERWRRAQPVYGDSYIRVNVAEQMLSYVHDGELAIQMPVIVGRSDRPTPSTVSELREVVFNPYWEVPTRIAVRDKLPLIREDPSYLTHKNFIVRESWAPDAAVLDPQTIDWSMVTASNFRFRLSQKPGLENALGAVKFLFPNPYSVYLHDTPTQHLFKQSQRLFSSGCIRLSQPLELAELLLQNHGSDRPVVDRQAPDTRVRLTQSVPVHLEYWTAWIDHKGELQIRSDIYQRDESLLLALHQAGALSKPEELIQLAQLHPMQLALYQ